MSGVSVVLGAVAFCAVLGEVLEFGEDVRCHCSLVDVVSKDDWQGQKSCEE